MGEILRRAISWLRRDTQAEVARAHAALDRCGVPRMDDNGRTLTLTGRIAFLEFLRP